MLNSASQWPPLWLLVGVAAASCGGEPTPCPPCPSAAASVALAPAPTASGSAAAPPKAAAEPSPSGCPKDLDRHDKEPHSNAAFYRGGCLKKILHVKGTPKPDAALPNGEVEATIDVRGNPTVKLQVEAAGQDRGPGLNLYVVKLDGQNLCANQSYSARSAERARVCGANASCEALTALEGRAVAVPGYWQMGGWHPMDAANPVYTLSCYSGAVAECAHMGYVPWRAKDKTSLEPYYTACVQALTARYAPSDKMDYQSFTCPGTEIDIYDRLGVSPKGDVAGFTLESVWTKDGLFKQANGAACLDHTRWAFCDGIEGVTPKAGACADPVDKPGGKWSASYPAEALLAVAGRQQKSDRGTCPRNSPDACPGSAKR